MPKIRATNASASTLEGGDDGDYPSLRQRGNRSLLEGVNAASPDAERSAIDMASLISTDRKRLLASPKGGVIGYRLFELLPMMPRFSIGRVRQRLETTFSTASAAVKLLEDAASWPNSLGRRRTASTATKRMWNCSPADKSTSADATFRRGCRNVIAGVVPRD